MKTKLFVLLFGCLTLVLSPLASGAVTSPFVTEGKINGVMYASGGVGKDERMSMESMAKGYNVKLIFAEAPREYVAGVKVKIEDHSGRTLLEATSGGPWFWVKLPQGDYRIIASFRDHGDIKNLKVGNGFETVEFLWTASVKATAFPVAARIPAAHEQTKAAVPTKP